MIGTAVRRGAMSRAGGSAHGRSKGPARADQIKILVSQDSEYSSGQRT